MSWRPRATPPQVVPTKEIVPMLDDKGLLQLLRHSDQLTKDQWTLVNDELQRRLKRRAPEPKVQKGRR